MFSTSSHESVNFFGLALVKGFIVAGLFLLAGAVLQVAINVPAVWVIGVGGLLGGVVFLRDFASVAGWLEYVWRERQRAEAARLEFETRLYSGQWPAPETLQPAPPAAPGPNAPRVTVGHPKGAYTLPPLSPEEEAERAAIGDALAFLTVAERAGGWSGRTMQTCRPPQFTESQFEAWWKKQTDQLAHWGLLEKADRAATKPTAAYPTFNDIRTALLRRTFRRHPAPPRTADRQTDSGAGESGGAWQPFEPITAPTVHG